MFHQEISGVICFIITTGNFMCHGVSGTHELGSVCIRKCQHETQCGGICMHMIYPVEILNLSWIRKRRNFLQCQYNVGEQRELNMHTR